MMQIIIAAKAEVRRLTNQRDDFLKKLELANQFPRHEEMKSEYLSEYLRYKSLLNIAENMLLQLFRYEDHTEQAEYAEYAELKSYKLSA